MDLTTMRQEIDTIDDEMTLLFKKRMQTVEQISQYKRQHHLPVLHSDREQQVLCRVSSLAGEELAESTRLLFTTIMDLSKAQQNDRLPHCHSHTQTAICEALRRSRTLPAAPVVACQGIDGAYSSLAARNMFPNSTLQFYKNFSDVFGAVKSGASTIGVLPIENSTAGSVNNVYDLMKEYHFSIVRGFRLEVLNCLLVKPGVLLEEITDIYSHEQAIHQCSEFLQAHPQMHVHFYSNTAAAARFVSECSDRGVAAIASAECAALYGLRAALPTVRNAQKNYTRFIAISNRLLLTEDADKMSIALTLPHEAGSLYKLITQFATQALNLTKIESRPLPDTNFEFLFYFDFNGNASNPNIIRLLSRLEQQCGYFEFLGNYKELSLGE